MQACTAIALIAVITGPARAVAQQALALDDRVPPFTLADQFGTTVAVPDSGARVIVLLYGDQRGSAFLNPYAIAVEQHLRAEATSAHVVVIQVAGLRGVPFFARGSVRARFRRTQPDGSPAMPVALDWHGEIPRKLGGVPDLANVYVVDAAGRLRYRSSGQGSAEEVQALLTALNASL